jgi:hypothetical protein
LKKLKKETANRFLILIFLIIGFAFTPFFQVIKSYSVMAVYSKVSENNSFMKKENISIQMPGGLSTWQRDYYPFVITYDTTHEFSKHLNKDVDLVILYNFGAMKWLSGSSLMYDEDSPYYSGYYGAYLVRYNDLDRQYGLKDNGNIYIEEILQVTNFDLKTLVTKNLGNQNPEIECIIVNEEQPYERIIDGIVFDADQIVEFSKLPTRLELISKLMATINAPLQNVVYVLNAVPQKLVRTLQAVVDKMGE